MGEIVHGIAIGGAVLVIFAFVTSIPSLAIANNFDINDCIMNVSPDPNAWLNIYGIVAMVAVGIMMILGCIARCNKDLAVPIIAVIGIVYYLFYIIYCTIGAKLVFGDLIDCINDGNPVAIMILIDAIFYLIIILISLIIFMAAGW